MPCWLTNDWFYSLSLFLPLIALKLARDLIGTQGTNLNARIYSYLGKAVLCMGGNLLLFHSLMLVEPLRF